MIFNTFCLRFAKKLEETLSYLMLILNFTTAASVCFLAFHLSFVSKLKFLININMLVNFINFSKISEDFFDGIKIMMFILVIQKDFVMFSYFGDKLMYESVGVGIEISNLPFYNIRSTEIQKYLILIMLRSQQPIGVTAGKFYHLNLRSFSEACKLMLKYFTVLRTVMGKN